MKFRVASGELPERLRVARCELPGLSRLGETARATRYSLLSTVRATRNSLLATILALFACATEVTRERWVQMNEDDRVLYVKTLIGEQLSKDAKGGGGKKFSRPAEEYVKLIDEAYARGDARDVPAIFAELGSP